MANITIPQLPAAIALTGSEQLEAVQNSTSVRVTASQIAALATSSSVIANMAAQIQALSDRVTQLESTP